jgi:hypothetical protein
VIHCAGLKAVGESVREPLAYYENNFLGTLNLLKAWPTRTPHPQPRFSPCFHAHHTLTYMTRAFTRPSSSLHCSAHR